MLIVRVPPWAAASKKFKIPANVEQNMPKAATTHPVDLYVTGIELAWAAAMSGRPRSGRPGRRDGSGAQALLAQSEGVGGPVGYRVIVRQRSR